MSHTTCCLLEILASNFMFAYVGMSMGRFQEERNVLMKGGKLDLKGGVWRGQQNTHDMDMEREIVGDEGSTQGWVSTRTKYV